MKRLVKSSYMSIVLMLLYVPMFVFMVMSFSGGDSIDNFTNFSFRWYGELFKNTPLLDSIFVSVIVALFTGIISVIIALFAALGLSKCRQLTRKISLSVNNIPIINADIIVAISLMLLFLLFGVHFGIVTLLLAHISFDVPYAMLIIMPQLRKIDQNLINSSLDLGARPAQTLWKIIIPKLKTALLSAFIVAFAMSFDDFLVSYFNSGAVTNVSTFIYSQKKIKLYVNAFGTLFVAVLAVCLFSWNIGQLVVKKRKTMHKALVTNSYKDKAINKWEQKLTKHYWQLNQQIHNRNEHYRLICKYERKLVHDQKWAWQQKQKIRLRGAHMQIVAQKERQHYWWWIQNWKKLFMVFIIVAAIAILTAFYIMNGVYDLKVANWGTYFTPGLIQQFEEQYHVKVLYTPYNSNESLYNKLYNASYDVMVPSDYMVKKLATEGRLAPIDYKMLNSVSDGYHIYKPYVNLPTTYNKYEIDEDYEKQNYPDWQQKYFPQHKPLADFTKAAYATSSSLDVMRKNNWTDSAGQTTNILNYCVPYIWGDLRLVGNLTNTANIKWLHDQGISVHSYTVDGTKNYYVDDPTKLSWNILWKAAAAGKKVVLNDDYKNIFMLANQRNFGTEQPTTLAQEQKDVAALRTLFSYHNVSIQDDEISNTVGDGNFDFAYMFNGDLLQAQRIYFQNHPATSKFLATIPRKMHGNNPEGTNVYSDNMVLNKNDAHNKLAYEFISFMIQHAKEVINHLQFTSPWQQLNDALLNRIPNKQIKPTMASVPQNYVPVPTATVHKKSAKTGVQPHYPDYQTVLQKNDQPFLLGNLDQKMLDDYNQLIAERD